MAAVVTGLAMIVPALSGPAAAGGSPAGPRVTAPLAAAVTTGGGTWAVVAMGRLGDPVNTFWQLFFRAPTATRWSLVTPPGVADNGGLVVTAPAAGPVTVGFEPSQLLRFSPLAQTADDGTHWSADALVPASLAPAPDALAYQAGPAGGALALVGPAASRVLGSAPGLLSWSTATTARALAAGAGGACGVDGLDAVAWGSSPLVGTGCDRGGRVGIFARQSGRWRAVGPTLSGALGRSPTRVLRLAATGSTTSALVAAAGPGGTEVVALWRSGGGAWVASPPLPARRVLSTATGPGSGFLVLSGGGGGAAAPSAVTGPGRAWTRLPAPPAGATTLAPMGDGTADAFAVSGARLRVYALAAGGTAWRMVQTMTVPLAYGSSG